MYFDLSRLSFYMVLLFFILNLGTNLLRAIVPISPMGLGYLVSITLSLLVGLEFLLYTVSDMEYNIFRRQED